MKKTVHVGSLYNPCCRVCDINTRKELMAMGLSYFSVPSVFIACPNCGNKRCPKAHYHGYQCTGSNDIGQVSEFDQGQA